MSTIITLPLSAAVLGTVIEAFDLRSFDEALTAKNRTTARFLEGCRVGDDERSRIFAAVGRALVEAKVVPDVFSGSGSPGTDCSPPGDVLGAHLLRTAGRWDALAGALRRASCPVSSPRVAFFAVLQLVTIDLAVRLAGLMWLSDAVDHEDGDRPPWSTDSGMPTWLRALQKKSGLTRDRLAEAVKVNENTLDSWLDAGVRPSDENLQDLAHKLADHLPATADDLLTDLRRAYGLRELFARVVEVVGEPSSAEMVARLFDYSSALLWFPRSSNKAFDENQRKMQLALACGAFGEDGVTLPFLPYMLNSVHRNEPDAGWRTSLVAATASWFERMQAVAAKLGDPEGAARERLLASRAELAREPAARAALASEANEPGFFGALELKLRACEMEDLASAIPLLREAARRDPGNAEIHFRLGASLWQIDAVAEALTELELSVALDPGWDRAYAEIAIVHLNSGEPRLALARLERAMPLVRDVSAWLLFILGVAYERTGAVGEAATSYERVLDAKPDHAEALDRLAHLRFAAGQKREGARLAKRAAQLGFTDVFDAWSAGYYNRGACAERPPTTTPRGLVELGVKPSAPLP